MYLLGYLLFSSFHKLIRFGFHHAADLMCLSHQGLLFSLLVLVTTLTECRKVSLLLIARVQDAYYDLLLENPDSESFSVLANFALLQPQNYGGFLA